MSIVKFHKTEEKIFSRRRFILPTIEFNNVGGFKQSDGNNKKKKKTAKVFAIFMIGIFIAKTIIDGLNPIINNQCINTAKSIATLISNEQATIVMEKYKYEDLAVIIRDESEKIQMIKLNIIPVNEIISDVAIRIQTELNNVESSYIGIRLGSLTGVRLLAGFGPKIKIRISSVGNVETDLKSEFKTAGINQTLHQIYLEIKCEILILTPYDTVREVIINQILIAESIIVGDIPGSYYNFNGQSNSDAIRFMD